MELVQYKGAAVERDIQHPALKKVLEFLKIHDVSQDKRATTLCLMISFTMSLK